MCLDRVLVQVEATLARHAQDAAAWCGAPWGNPWCLEPEILQTKVSEVALRVWLLGAEAGQRRRVPEDFMRWQERVFFGKPLVQRVKQGGEVCFVVTTSESEK